MIAPIANASYPAQAAPKAPPASVKLATDTVTLQGKPTGTSKAMRNADHDGDAH